MNYKILTRLGSIASFDLTNYSIEGIINAKQGFIEKAILQVKRALIIFRQLPTSIPLIAKPQFVPDGDYDALSDNTSALGQTKRKNLTSSMSAKVLKK